MRGVLGRYNLYIGYADDDAAATTVEVDTKLRLCYFSCAFTKGNGVSADAISIDEDFTSGPLDGSAITFDKTAGIELYWLAIGLP
jgi:hypothetical protein